MLKVPFSETVGMSLGYDGIDTTFRVFMRKPGTIWRDGQELYGMFRVLTPNQDDLASIASMRKEAIDNLLELVVIYYDEGYTELCSQEKEASYYGPKEKKDK